MSKEFSQSFFPSSTTFVSSPGLAPSPIIDSWNAIFPDDVAASCSLPPPRHDAYNTPIRRPCLAVAASIGALLGLNRKSRRRRISHREDAAEDDASWVLLHSIREAWDKSLTAFGMMNVAAFAHHCAFPPPASYQNVNGVRRHIDNIFWGADCIFTGISSINLVILACLIYRGYRGKHNSMEAKSLKDYVRRLRVTVHASLLALSAILSALLEHLLRDGVIEFWATASTSVEMIYLLPVEAAALFLFPLVVTVAFNAFGLCGKRSIAGARVAILGGILILAPVPLDASICRFVSDHVPTVKASPWLNDVYHLPTILFLGCDISFLGLGMWVNDLTDGELWSKSEKDL